MKEATLWLGGMAACWCKARHRTSPILLRSIYKLHQFQGCSLSQLSTFAKSSKRDHWKQRSFEQNWLLLLIVLSERLGEEICVPAVCFEIATLNRVQSKIEQFWFYSWRDSGLHLIWEGDRNWHGRSHLPSQLPNSRGKVQPQQKSCIHQLWYSWLRIFVPRPYNRDLRGYGLS